MEKAAEKNNLPSTETIKKFLPWLVAVAFFMESLDTTILNTAVPKMAEALAVLPLSMKSVLSSYTLSLAVFIPISSWMADRFGTRRVFASAIGVFTLGSLLCGLASNIHLMVFCRILQGFGGAMMVPVGRLTLIRTFSKGELINAMSFVAIPALIGPMLGPLLGGFMVSFLHWRIIFFVNVPIGLFGLYAVYKNLPDYRSHHVPPMDLVGLIFFGTGIALLSYVLEVFGEHTLSSREISSLFFIALVLLGGYAYHAQHFRHPLLDLNLFKIRTLRTAVSGNFITRLGVGGLPFLLPLLYQVGLGYSPIESGLLIMPQSIASMSLKAFIPKILTRLGYRNVLMVNTVFMGIAIMLFATIGVRTPVWLIVLQAAVFGAFSSLQYTSMNTLGYADINDDQASMASTIVSTTQQLSLSFGVAAASLIAAFFVPALDADTLPIIKGIHKAFLILGLLTIFSAFVFWTLRKNDGESISHHKGPMPADDLAVAVDKKR